jgi:hypothetical protein
MHDDSTFNSLAALFGTTAVSRTCSHKSGNYDSWASPMAAPPQMTTDRALPETHIGPGPVRSSAAAIRSVARVSRVTSVST